MHKNLPTIQHEPVFAAVERSGVLIPADEVRRRCGGVSDMTLYRWLKNTSFPRPRIINRQRYWLDIDIDAYIDGLPEG